MTWLWLPAVVVLGYGIWVFNRLIADRNLARQGFADIDVQLKRRADLVPQLVEVVRGYAAYERALARGRGHRCGRRRAASGRDTAGSHSERLGCRAQLGGAMAQLILLQENYPQLKADANFRDLSAQAGRTSRTTCSTRGASTTAR